MPNQRPFVPDLTVLISDEQGCRFAERPRRHHAICGTHTQPARDSNDATRALAGFDRRTGLKKPAVAP
jgi:hypothetical protein